MKFSKQQQSNTCLTFVPLITINNQLTTVAGGERGGGAGGSFDPPDMGGLIIGGRNPGPF